MKRLPTPRPVTPEVFAVPVPDTMPDPVCSKACGTCWACRRKADGPLWFLKGAPKP